MGKYIAKLVTICAVATLAIAPAAGAYKVPTPKKGSATTKKTTTKTAKQLQSKTGKNIAKGLTISVKFPSAGKITITIKGGGKTLGTGKASSSKAGTKKVKIKFTSAGKKFLENHAGSKVSVTTTFKPKKGKSSTSTVSVKLG